MKTIKIIGLSIALSLSAISPATAQEKTPAIQGVLDAGAQMSNVRLMLEAYVLTGVGIHYSNPKELLKRSINSYEKTLKIFETTFKNPTIQESVKKSYTAWVPVKKVLETIMTGGGAPDEMKKGGLFVHDHIRSIIKGMSAIKKVLLTQSKIKNADALNAAIEIGASARRLSSHFMMRMWKLDDPTIEKHWKNGIKIYGDSLLILKKSPFASDPEIQKLLKESEKDYQYFKMKWSMGTSGGTLIHKKAEKIYEDSRKMTEIILSK